jgi:hypothetical protein
MYDELKRVSDRVDALEPIAEAKSIAKTKPYGRVFSSESEVTETYDLIALLDVLAHVEDDKALLLRLPLNEGGFLILNCVAFPFLWSTHDILQEHYRRYTKKGLIKLLSETGYEVKKISFWNMFLFPPAVLMRLLGRVGDESLNPVLNALCLWAVKLDLLLMRVFSLPFGLSLIVLAEKKKSSHN